MRVAGVEGGGEGSGRGGDPGAQPSSSAAEGRLPQSSAPAFLLVHGFGAFGEQWRGQIKALTAAGYQVASRVKLACHISMTQSNKFNVNRQGMRYNAVVLHALGGFSKPPDLVHHCTQERSGRSSVACLFLIQ